MKPAAPRQRQFSANPHARAKRLRQGMVRYDEKSNSKTRQSSHGKSPSVKVVALEDFKIRKPPVKMRKARGAPAMRVVPPLTKSSLEPVREKIRAFI